MAELILELRKPNVSISQIIKKAIAKIARHGHGSQHVYKLAQRETLLPYPTLPDRRASVMQSLENLDDLVSIGLSCLSREEADGLGDRAIVVGEVGDEEPAATGIRAREDDARCDRPEALQELGPAGVSPLLRFVAVGVEGIPTVEGGDLGQIAETLRPVRSDGRW